MSGSRILELEEESSGYGKKGFPLPKKIFFIILFLAGWLCGQDKFEINVYGKKIPFRFDPKRDVLVIEGEFLKHIPSFNLPQLISFLANMNFVSRGLFQADSQMMGFNQEQVAVLVNGTPLNNAQTGHHNFSLPFDVDQVERIEVLRGGYSSRYNFSGAGGLVNIITSTKNRFKVSRSSFNTWSPSFSVHWKNFYFSSGLTSTDGYLEGLDGKKFSAQAGAKFSSTRDFLDIWGGWLSSKFGASNFYAAFPSFEEIQRLLGVVTWKSRLGTNLIFDLKFSSQYCADDFQLFRDNPQFYKNNHRTFQNSLEAGLNISGREFAYYLGLSSSFDTIRSRGIRQGEKAEALGDHSRQLFSFLGEFDWEKKNLFMNSGFQAASGSYSGWSGHALFGFRIQKNLKLSASLSRSFRIPTYTELYYSDPVHGANSALKPENTQSFSFSLESHQENTEWGTKFFYNRSHNLIDWEWQPEKSIWISRNLKTGKYYGVDLKFSHASKQTMLKILYTLQKALFEEDSSLKTLKYHYYFPDHSLSLIVNHNFSFIYTSGALKAERENHTKKIHFYVNLKVDKKFGKISLSFEILNLFNSRAEKVPGLLEPPLSCGLGLAYDF